MRALSQFKSSTFRWFLLHFNSTETSRHFRRISLGAKARVSSRLFIEHFCFKWACYVKCAGAVNLDTTHYKCETVSSHPDTVTGSNGSNCIVFSRALSNSLALFSCLCSLIFSLVELSPPNKCPLLFMQVWPRDPSHTPSSKQWCSVPHSQKLQLGRLFSTDICSYRGYTAFGHWCTSRSWVDCFFI